MYNKTLEIQGYLSIWGRIRGSNPCMPEPQSGVLTASPILPCHDLNILPQNNIISQYFLTINIRYGIMLIVWCIILVKQDIGRWG